MRRSTARREEGGVANHRIRTRVDKVLIVSLEEQNEEVPLVESHVPPEPQEPQVPHMPRAHFFVRYMTN